MGLEGKKRRREMRAGFIFIAAIFMAVLSGCASLDSDVYSHPQARTRADVYFGVVNEVRPVRVQGKISWVGPTVGAVIGGVGAGAGTNDYGYGAAGATVGGLLGAGAEKVLTRSDGLELTVTLDNGQSLVVVQGPGEKFSPGDRIKLIAMGDELRVTHAGGIVTKH
jgi:outer membrane lipoprotein SlyB